MKIKKNAKGFAGLLVLVLVVAVLVGSFYVIKAGLLTKVNPEPLDSNNSGSVTPDQDKVYKVDFAYKVKLVTKEQIVLNGQKGNFTLPNDPAKVTVYKGPTKESPKMPLSELKVDDNVNMEFVPGASVSLFVSAM